ncbi:tetratricopeptide repeat protein, partial [Gammaproteobacteria bacterium]|nr:tetratricopeptide repeat protein [Gammaproteobacteria bacterium]
MTDQYQLVIKELERLNSLPAEIRSVASFLYEGKLFKAERLCREYLKRHPKNTEAMRLLALIGAKLQVLDDAEFLLESALEFEPNNFQIRTDYIGILQRRQKFSQALEQARLIQESDPDQNAFKLIYANALAAAGKYDEALELYLKELPNQPRNGTLQMAMGHAYKTIGNQQKAITSYERATRIRDDFGDAYWSLANLKTYKFSNKQIQSMEKAVSDPETNLDDQYHACFALGKALEDKGEFEQSFKYYERGNSLKKTESRYDAKKMTEELTLQMEVCSKSFFQERSGV